jgi:hypothetical protein
MNDLELTMSSRSPPGTIDVFPSALKSRLMALLFAFGRPDAAA